MDEAKDWQKAFEAWDQSLSKMECWACGLGQ